MTQTEFGDAASPRQSFYVQYNHANVSNIDLSNDMGKSILVGDSAGIYDRAIFDIINGKQKLPNFNRPSKAEPPESSAASIVKSLLGGLFIPRTHHETNPPPLNNFYDDTGAPAIQFVNPITGKISKEKTHHNIAVATKNGIIPGVEELFTALLDIAPLYFSTISAENKIEALLNEVKRRIELGSAEVIYVEKDESPEPSAVSQSSPPIDYGDLVPNTG